MNAELIRIVDGLAREKNIDKDIVLGDLELAMESAIRKKYGPEEEVTVTIDRLSGEIAAVLNGEPISMNDLGRIAAQTAKQVMIQKIREAERGSIYEEFVERKGTILTGTVSRFEGGALIVNIGRTEGFLPRSEQISGETHQPGERIRTLILEVREAPHQVKIILSRSHPDFIRRLFEVEVPEVAERIIEIKALAREAGYRTKVAVSSIDTKVDAVGACVGVRGSRIKNIVEELGGEKIDIVRWNESSQILISNALKPAEVQDTALCFELGRATVVVPEEQLSLAIGKRGQNVRLAARLTGWDIDILTPKEYNKGLDRLATTLRTIEGMDEMIAERISLLGMISVMDVQEVGPDTLVAELDLTKELAEIIVNRCTEEAKLVEVERAEEKSRAAEALKAGAAAQSETESSESESSEVESSEAVSGEVSEAPAADSSDDASTSAEATDASEPEAVEEKPSEPAADDSAMTEKTEEATPGV
ncbi:MAG: transcription termination/antitermination protein NusA [Planctomycetia bacterium]|nr:transcription termination/antitermination protein NusA [Planctomycetia bacterium]